MAHWVPQVSQWQCLKPEAPLPFVVILLFPSCPLLQDLTMDTDLTAANGKKVKALEIFAYALQYFKEQALKVGTYQCFAEGIPACQGSRISQGIRVSVSYSEAWCTHMHCW